MTSVTIGCLRPEVMVVEAQLDLAAAAPSSAPGPTTKEELPAVGKPAPFREPPRVGVMGSAAQLANMAEVATATRVTKPQEEDVAKMDIIEMPRSGGALRSLGATGDNDRLNFRRSCAQISALGAPG